MGITERAVRRIREGTSAVFLQSGLDEKWRTDSMECYCHLRNVQDLVADGKTLYERRWTIWRLGHSVRCNGWISSDFCKRPFKAPTIRQNNFTRRIFRICIDRGGDIIVADILRSWKIWTRQKSMIEDSIKRSVNARKGEHFMPDRGWIRNIVWKKLWSPRIHSETGTTCDAWRSQVKISKQLGEVSTDRNERWRWIPKWLLVTRKWLHFSTSSSALRAESRIIPNPIEVYWRDQMYAHKSGCVARKRYWRLLERRRGPKVVRFMDRIHEVHVVEWDFPSMMLVVREATYKDPSYYQSKLSVPWNLVKNIKSC